MNIRPAMAALAVIADAVTRHVATNRIVPVLQAAK
jgi:hypothetical protein